MPKPETQRCYLLFSSLKNTSEFSKENVTCTCQIRQSECLWWYIHCIHKKQVQPSKKRLGFLDLVLAHTHLRYLTSPSYLGRHDVLDLFISSWLCNRDVRIAAAYHSALQEFTPDGHCRSAPKCVITRLRQSSTAPCTCPRGDVWTKTEGHSNMRETWDSSRLCSVLHSISSMKSTELTEISSPAALLNYTGNE